MVSGCRVEAELSTKKAILAALTTIAPVRGFAIPTPATAAGATGVEVEAEAAVAGAVATGVGVGGAAVGRSSRRS